jgi:hypothetical protein
MSLGPLSPEFKLELFTDFSCCWQAQFMQHSNKAKELLSDHWKERIVVVQQMAGLHHNFIRGNVWRR